MRREQQMVQEFHTKAGAVVNNKPTWPDKETRELRFKLIYEELDELGQAFHLHFGRAGLDHNQDLEPVADAIGDLLYVVLGTAVSCGVNIEPIFHEIHRSNMTKFIDGHKRDDGKWVKGPSYEPANLAPIVRAQIEPKPWVDEGEFPAGYRYCSQCRLRVDQCVCNPL